MSAPLLEISGLRVAFRNRLGAEADLSGVDAVVDAFGAALLPGLIDDIVV